MYKSIGVVFSVLMFLSVLFTPAMAGQKTISLQGKLTDPTSNYAPITGVHTLYFRLYAAPTGGSPLWTEQHLVNLPNNGVFNVVLGSSSTLDAIAFNRPYYVGIVVDGTNEMTPRQPLSATPYSFGSISDMNVGKDLYVVGNSSVACSLFVSSNVAVSGSMNLTKDLNVSGKVNVGTALFLSSTAVVSGNAVLQGSATINGSASILSNMSINGNTFITGKVGIGTNNPAATLDVNGDIYTSVNGRVSTNNLHAYGAGKNLEIKHGGNGYGHIIFGTQQGTERMRICNNGNVGIGTSDPSHMLTINGELRVMQGSAWKPNGGSWSNWSDIRLKKNIHPMNGALDEMLKLRGVTYEWIDPVKQGATPGTHAGMIAQEVEKVFPEWVNEDDSGYKYITYYGFEALTVESVKELYAEIIELKKEIAALQGKLNRKN